MKTLCPTCKTRYDIDPKALLEADGLARCFRCGTVFEAVSEDAPAPGVTYAAPVGSAVSLDEEAELPAGSGPETQDEPTGADESREAPPKPESIEPTLDTDQLPTAQDLHAPADDAAGPSPLSPALDNGVEQAMRTARIPVEAPEDRLPFDLPADLAPLEPSPDVALDVIDTLYQKKSRRGFFYGLIALLLVAGLGLQLAWQYRKDLVRQYSFLQPVCEYIGCFPTVVHAPGAISVVQRDIKPATNQPGSLTLSATMRNDADIAQNLPDIQLSLLDNNGAVLIRRRLTPADYLFPAPAKGKVMAPGEVVTIALDFQDPGHQASGFLIDFL